MDVFQIAEAKLKEITLKRHHASSCFRIYIYIYCHPQTHCFVVSQHFVVAKCLKLG